MDKQRASILFNNLLKKSLCGHSKDKITGDIVLGTPPEEDKTPEDITRIIFEKQKDTKEYIVKFFIKSDKRSMNNKPYTFDKTVSIDKVKLIDEAYDVLSGSNCADEDDLFGDYEPTVEEATVDTIKTDNDSIPEPVEAESGLPSFDDVLETSQDVISLEEYNELLAKKYPTDDEIKKLNKYDDSNNATIDF